MRPQASRRRGTALVITVGLLAVLAIIGFGFATVSRIHHETGMIYRSATNLELISTAGVMYAVRDVRYGWSNARPAADATDSYYDLNVLLHSYDVGALAEPTDSAMNTWFRNRLYPDDLYVSATSTKDYCLHKISSYSLIHDVLGGEFAVSYVAMQDAASKINLNDENANNRLRDMLATLFSQIGLATLSGDSLADTGYFPSSNTMMATKIIEYRNSAAVGGAFTALEQLLQVEDAGNPIISPRRLDILRNYVTIYSWPHDPPSVVQNAAGDEITPRVVAPHNQATSYPTLQDTPNRRRSPININTAPYAVLVAVLSNIESQSGGHKVDLPMAQEIAKWICRKRDPESLDPWRRWGDTMTAEWIAWLNAAGYRDQTNGVRSRMTRGWREYPLGPFDTWNEFIDFVYSLTDPASSGNEADDDPFPQVTGFDEGEAEAIIAATCPSSFATIVARNTYHLSAVRLNRADAAGSQTLAYQARGPKEGSPIRRYRPDIVGKNQLASTGYRTEFCFHSRGRYEIQSRTFGFIKADQGDVSSAGTNSLDCTGRSWSSAAVDDSLPTQWRGYSVIIYDGKGKGQLRGIVTNDSDTLTVAKWSTPLSSAATDTSRFYILGPGPLLDVEGKGSSIALDSSGSLLKDPNATWEDDEWNGYRLLIFRSNDAEEADESTIQERVILDTLGGTKKTLVVSPALENSAAGTHWDYMILGATGSIPHEAAVKAFDVVYHNTQDDFAPNNTVGGAVDADGYAKVAVFPNPLTGNVKDGGGANQAAVPSSKIDGWVTVGTKPTGALNITGLTCVFRHDFRTRDLEPEASPGGGWNASTDRATLIDDVFENGRLLADGLHLRAGSGQYAKFFASQALVNPNEPTAGNEADAGFVSLWYRPDAVTTGDRCIVRINGKAADAAKPNDIRLILSGNVVTGTPAPTLKIVVRQDGAQLYKGRQLTDGSDPPQNIDVKCRATDVVTGKTATSIVVSAWRPGEWHHICFAWYEAENDQANVVDSDGKPATSSENDSGADFTVLDDNEVLGYVRLWVDGVPNTDNGTLNAFNLVPQDPAATYPSIHIGEEGTSTPGGTIDSLTVYKHDKGKALSTSFDAAITALHDGTNDDVHRYVNGETVTFPSPTIYLPPDLAGRDITLGTVAWTAFYPYPDDAGTPDATQDLLTNKDHYPVRVRVKVTGGTLSQPLPDPTATTTSPKISPFGGGGPLRTGAALTTLITQQAPDPPTLSYDVLLEAYHGTKDRSSRHWVPMYSQAPVLDDITITYFCRSTYYHWR